jgi:hypothetical protein
MVLALDRRLEYRAHAHPFCLIPSSGYRSIPALFPPPRVASALGTRKAIPHALLQAEQQQQGSEQTQRPLGCAALRVCVPLVGVDCMLARTLTPFVYEYPWRGTRPLEAATDSVPAIAAT